MPIYIFPARVVLVLIRGGSDVEMCRKLSAALDNFFALVCSMNGQCRLPFFGLIALGAQPEVHTVGDRLRLFMPFGLLCNVIIIAITINRVKEFSLVSLYI